MPLVRHCGNHWSSNKEGSNSYNATGDSLQSVKPLQTLTEFIVKRNSTDWSICVRATWLLPRTRPDLTNQEPEHALNFLSNLTVCLLFIILQVLYCFPTSPQIANAEYIRWIVMYQWCLGMPKLTKIPNEGTRTCQTLFLQSPNIQMRQEKNPNRKKSAEFLLLWTKLFAYSLILPFALWFHQMVPLTGPMLSSLASRYAISASNSTLSCTHMMRINGFFHGTVLLPNKQISWFDSRLYSDKQIVCMVLKERYLNTAYSSSSTIFKLSLYPSFNIRHDL